MSADHYQIAPGNWNANATWSDTDGGAAGSSYPVAGDNVYRTATTDNRLLTVNVASACASLTKAVGCIGQMAMAADLTISGTWTPTGSAANRDYVYSTVRGTPHAISAGAVTAEYLDLEDVTAAGAASWDLRAIPGGSGDCGGNSGAGLQFTVAAGNWLRGSGNRSFSTAANWADAVDHAAGTGRVPLPQDTAYLGATTGSGTITQNLPRVGSIICTGHTGTYTESAAFVCYGSLMHSSGQSVPDDYRLITLAGRGSYQLTAAGKFGRRYIKVDAPTGTVSLQDDLVITFIGLTLTRGHFDNSGNHNVTGSVDIGGTFARTLTMGSGTWLVNVFNVFYSATNLTLNKGTGLIKIVGGGEPAFFGCSLYPFHNLEIATTTQAKIYYTCTFDQVKIDAGANVRFWSNQTYTAGTWDIVGTPASPITISGVAAAATLAKSGGGTVAITYATISYITASPVSTFSATSSTDNGHNTNIEFITFVTREIATGLDALVAATRTVPVGLDALIARTRTATVGLGALVAKTDTAAVGLDALVAAKRTTSVGLDAIIVGPVGAIVTARTRDADVVAVARETEVTAA